jgi:hypothetical protein
LTLFWAFNTHLTKHNFYKRNTFINKSQCSHVKISFLFQSEGSGMSQSVQSLCYRIKIPESGRGFFSFLNVHTSPWAHLVSYLMGTYLASFPGGRWVGHEVDHSHPSNAKVNNEWSHTSTPPIHLHV